jgi:hypothetical protein
MTDHPASRTPPDPPPSATHRDMDAPPRDEPPPTLAGPDTLGGAPPPVGGRYRVLRELGRGGMGVVYQARDTERNQVVALKTLQGVSAAALYRFKQEFRALAGVSHKNLVALYDFVADARTWFFTMEYVEGVPFFDHLHGTAGPPADTSDTDALSNDQIGGKKGDSPGRTGEAGAFRPPPEGRLRDAFGQLAEGVLALHAAGKLHRDLKPGNVLVAAGGRVVLLDFGLAADLDATGRHHSTEPGLLGTAAYMAPEQAANQPLSPAGDWYAVGVMLYEALTGRLPFDGGPIEVLLQKRQTDPTPVRSLAPDAPEDLAELCMELLRRDPAARPSGPDVLRRLHGPEATAPPSTWTATQRPPFVGRAGGLAALADAFRAAESGRPVTAFVSGRSGMGKSTLVQHFLDGLAARPDVLVLAGRCYEREAVPYKAVDSLIDALSRFLKRLPRLEAQALLPRDAPLLARVFPVLQRVEAVAGTPRRGLEVPDAQELRRRAFAALRELLARVGDRRRLVLVIDDLQWADVDGAALLADLLRPPDPPALLLLGCYRSEDEASSPVLRALVADAGPDARRLDVDALTPDEARDLARSLLGDDAAAHADAVARESGGSPLFVYELVQHLRGGVGAPAVALTLDSVLWDRITQLPEPARRLLDVVAVAGRPIRQAAAAQAAGVEGDARAWLQRLQAARLVRTAGPAEREEVEPYHDRIRETVTARLPAEALRDAHGRVARALEADPDADPEALAGHFLAASDRAQAAGWFARAADQAAAALAFDRAARLYRLVLEHGAGDAEARRRVRIKLGEALGNAGRGAESAREYLAAADGAGDAEARGLRQKAAWQFLISGHVDEGLAVLRGVLAAVGLTMPASPGRAVWSLLCRRAQLRLRGLGFRPRPGPLPPGQAARIDVCWSAAVGLGVVDYLSGAYFQTRGLLLALAAGEPYAVARALAVEAAHSSTGGTRTRRRTARILDMTERLARQVDRPHVFGLSAMAKGLAAAFEGRWKEAVTFCDESERILRDDCTGVIWELDTAHRFALWALVFRGEAPEINRRLPALLQQARERDDLYAVVNLSTVVQPFARLAADEPLRARAELAEVMARWSQQGFHVQHMNRLYDEATIDLYLGDAAASLARLYAAWPLLERSHLLRVQQVRIFLAHLRGRAALASGKLFPANDDACWLLCQRAAWADALAKLLFAGLAARRGNRDGAARLLTEAAAELDAADMGLYAAAARRRLGALVGGDEGRALVVRADAVMAERQVKAPEKMTAFYAPGFVGAGEGVAS